MSTDEDGGPTFTLSSAFRPSTTADDAVARMVAVLDTRTRRPRSSACARLDAPAAGDVRRGEVCVDLGSGTGTMTRRLANLTGHDGRAVGVEPNGALREVARAQAGRSARSRSSGSLATAIPFDDGSVDVVWCERVLQHVPEPGWRSRRSPVLRPGGRALLVDSDHDTGCSPTSTPRRGHAIKRAFMGQVANPIGRPAPAAPRRRPPVC